ncbi:hypothetical protein Sps_03502 [Shewanella psychrophila]|uniref:Uncharacterized protein n=1 Tax=Shewanella psychrophila TaxID=225848 RepID=A0A1S6HT01_9GAMM|nr:hypothetical protein [Shewanella psychrophila]AQS38629.1 hypothetical protein Sps_03502 [Shewanella psychrophila]
MKYLIWRASVKRLIEKHSDSDSAEGWESLADWKEYFIMGFTPLRAILNVKNIASENVE